MRRVGQAGLCTAVSSVTYIRGGKQGGAGSAADHDGAVTVIR